MTPAAAQAVGTTLQSIPAAIAPAGTALASSLPTIGSVVKAPAQMLGLGIAGLTNMVSSAAALPAPAITPKKRINKYLAPVSATVGFGAGTGSSPAAVRDTSQEDRPFTEAGMTRIGTTPSGAGIYDSGNTINGVKQVFSGDAPSNAFGAMGYTLGGKTGVSAPSDNASKGGSEKSSSPSKSGGGWGPSSSRPTGGGAGGEKSGPYGK